MPLLSDFNRWMLEHRGLMRSTLALYNPVISTLLQETEGDPSRLDAPTLRAFILKRAGRHTSGAKNLTAAIRMFLRFLIAEGKCPAGLDAAIPTVASWRLSALPRYLPPSDVERILNSCDVSTPVGLRDRAILLLLARLALRAGDIVGLKLNDIDWQQSTIRVSRKSRMEVQLPLTQEVGDAILEYMDKGRQPCRGDHLFVRAMAPLWAFTSGAVSTIVLRAIRRSGVSAPCRGAYVLRHSAATQMLRQGASLEEIGTVLRHRSIQTTAQYAKVDLALLRLVAQPWPEVRSC
jgi:site-specific recombinase XerD